jgi:uncharacterized protein (TIGR02145 family)
MKRQTVVGVMIAQNTGGYYDWVTAMDIGTHLTMAVAAVVATLNVRGICPSGWHLPSRAEWGELANLAGGTDTYGTGGTAGMKLKSSSGWNAYSGVPFGTDYYGFSTLPGGSRNSDGDFKNAGHSGYWMTATESGESSNAYYGSIHY